MSTIPSPTVSWEKSEGPGAGGICNTITYFVDGNDWGMLAPRSAICPHGHTDSTNWVKETSTMVEITMILGLIFIALVLARACSRTRVDWYRIIFLYVIGTLGVPLSIAIGPKYGGFNRIEGFGIMVHNMAEWFILSALWFGLDPHDGNDKDRDPCRKCTNCCCSCCESENSRNSVGPRFIVMYLWAMMTAISFLPLSPLFLIAMIQGSFCDWFLVLTFGVTAQKMQEHGGKYWWYGFSAALMHILTIQPLFVGFSLTYSILNGITVMFLIPTFIIYLWFASADAHTVVNVISPNPTGAFMMDKRRNILLKRLVNGEKEVPLAIEMNNYGASGDMKSRNVVGSTTPTAQDSGAQSGDNDMIVDSIIGKHHSMLSLLLKDGLLKDDYGRRKFWLLVAGAIILAVTNSVIGWTIPCMIDEDKLKELICG